MIFVSYWVYKISKNMDKKVSKNKFLFKLFETWLRKLENTDKGLCVIFLLNSKFYIEKRCFPIGIFLVPFWNSDLGRAICVHYKDSKCQIQFFEDIVNILLLNQNFIKKRWILANIFSRKTYFDNSRKN